MHSSNTESVKWVAIALKVIVAATAIALKVLEEKYGNSVREAETVYSGNYGLLLLDEQGELLSKQSLAVAKLLQDPAACERFIQKVVAFRPAKAVLTIKAPFSGVEVIAKYDEAVSLVNRLLGHEQILLINRPEIVGRRTST